jgi:hypothetical protein
VYLANNAGHPAKYENHPKIEGNRMLIGEGMAVGLEAQEGDREIYQVAFSKGIGFICSIY